jgi:hypothetical protein
MGAKRRESIMSISPAEETALLSLSSNVKHAFADQY